LQLVSCDGEGIIRVTDIRSSECVLSLDAHEDKIWALDLSSDGQLLVTGAADSTLKVFRDTTAELDLQNRQVEEKNILMEQRLANHLRFKEFEEALDLALEMGKPRQTLKVLSAIIENDIANGCSNVMTLQKHAKSWDSSRITQLLTYCREWNTRARNCQVSMLTVKAIFTSKAADELAFIDGLQDILEGILPYAERHFDRVDKLCMNSYLVDFILTSMGDVREDNVDEYQRWEKSSKYVLPPTVIDGRIQIGGQTLTGTGIDRKQSISSDEEVLSLECSSDGSVVTDDSSVGSLN
jgi:U3 small nucleolar RNA-associated protein 13